eukprot:scaffold381_cov138-Cylindrotheca_fusiformis.AAC.8
MSQKTTMNTPSIGSDNFATIIFDTSLVKQLNSKQVRIPANFVGVRRIRPHKLLEEKKKEVNDKISNVVFTVKGENGNERRMNNKEKKALKYKLRMQRKDERKRKRERQQAQDGLPSEGTRNPTTRRGGEANGKYYQIAVNNAVLEQELAELRGERNGIPPVLLSPALAFQALDCLPGSTKEKSNKKCALMYDHTLSLEWADLIKKSMQPAERARQKEQYRPMPYQLAPEPWTRLRPNIDEDQLETEMRSAGVGPQSSETSDVQSLPIKRQWAKMVCRPSTELDTDASLVFEYLHRRTDYFVSCGAKFGSDFLVYDGPREERHAFAGLRVLEAKDGKLPTPSAYSLSGYVRCLNTAGKFALLVTVMKETDLEIPRYRVAFVDMALEKVLCVGTRLSQEPKRKDMTQHLAKKQS